MNRSLGRPQEFLSKSSGFMPGRGVYLGTGLAIALSALTMSASAQTSVCPQMFCVSIKPKEDPEKTNLDAVEVIGVCDDLCQLERRIANAAAYRDLFGSFFAGAGAANDSGGGGAADGIGNSAPCPTANPVIVASGHKVKSELDFETHHLEPLSLSRNYNQNFNGQGLFGRAWASNFDVSLGLTKGVAPNEAYCPARPGQDALACMAGAPATKVTISRYDGSQLTYSDVGNNRFESTSPDADDWVIRQADGTWLFQEKAGGSITFTAGGLILSTRNKHGIGWTFTYVNSYLDRVTHTNAPALYVSFAWNAAGRVSQVTDPAGQAYTYGYNAGGYLTSVTYPGATGTRTYHYENAAQPQSLTGISVGGVRYSTYSYYPDGRTQTSGLMNGAVEQASFAYGENPDGTTWTRVTNAAGAAAKHTYQDFNGHKRETQLDQTQVTSCPDSAAAAHYDANGHRDWSIDQRNIKTWYSYDYTQSPNSLPTQIVTGDDLSGSNPGQKRITRFTWDYAKNRLTDIHRHGNSTSAADAISRTTYSYYPDSSPAKNRVQSVSVTNLHPSNGAYGQTLTASYAYQFHANGIPSRIVVSSPGTQVTREYDALGNLTSVVDAMGFTTSYGGYNGLGLPASVTDPNNFQASYTYDARGRTKSMSRTVDGVSATTTYAYDGFGNVTNVGYPDSSISYTYDAAGRLTEKSGETRTVNQPEYTEVTVTKEAYGYNLLSNRISLQGTASTRSCYWIDSFWSCGDSTQTLYSRAWSYDSLGRVTAEPGNNYAYDPNGNLKTRTDALGRVWTYEYNAHDQVRSIKDPLNQYTYFGYDGAGNLQAVTDPKGNATTYAYSGLGQMVTQTSPDTGVTTFEHDAQGRMWRMTRGDGSVTTHSNFDALNRAAVVQAGAQSVNYTFDSCTNGKRRVCSIADGSGSTSYTYRLTGQVASQLSVINGISYATSWQYDNRERVSRVTYPGGNYVSYAYAGRSLPSSVTANIGGTNVNLVTATSYVGFNLGPRSGMTFGNGIVESRSYDTHLRMTSLSSGVVQSMAYGYDANWQLTQLTNNLAGANSQAFAYDELGRLSGVTSAGLGNQGWTYDANGNRDTHTWGGATDDYVPDAYSNRIPTISGSRAKTFGFDTYLGNTTSRAGYGGDHGYAYDAFNRLGSVTTLAGMTTYTYNALNQRVRKSGPGGSFHYVYGPDGMPIGETSNGGTALTTHYVWLAGQLIGLIRNNTLYYVHSDHLARPEAITNAAKGVVWKASNTAFTRTVVADTIGGMYLAFPGHYLDVESGLYYNWRRYYDPGIGRYLQSDPIGLRGGVNTYSYAGSRPTMVIDPDGLAQACYRAMNVPGGGALYFADRTAATLSGGLTRAIDSRLNTVLAHQQIVYRDGKTSGYEKNGIFNESGKAYQACEGDYDDATMKKAEDNVQADGGFGPNDYSFIGNNCQDYVDAVVREYLRLTGE